MASPQDFLRGSGRAVQQWAFSAAGRYLVVRRVLHDPVVLGHREDARCSDGSVLHGQEVTVFRGKSALNRHEGEATCRAVRRKLVGLPAAEGKTRRHDFDVLQLGMNAEGGEGIAGSESTRDAD